MFDPCNLRTVELIVLRGAHASNKRVPLCVKSRRADFRLTDHARLVNGIVINGRVIVFHYSIRPLCAAHAHSHVHICISTHIIIDF
jgi:hypothetical protein